MPRDLLDTGISLFDGGSYFEAHEAFEDLWRPATGPARLMYQGLVQVCAGLVKHGRGQPGPACTLLDKGLSKLETVPEACREGLDLDRLVADLRSVREAIAMARDFAAPAIHRLGRI